MPLERIVAIGLLTKNDGQLLGPSFDRAWPIEEVPAFPDLLQAVDKQTLGWPQSVSSRNLHFLTLSREFADLRLVVFGKLRETTPTQVSSFGRRYRQRTRR